MRVASLHDRQTPRSRIPHDARHRWSLIAAIGKDLLDKRKPATRLRKNPSRAVSILHVVRMNNDAQQQAERVDENMALAARDFFAGVIALRVERRAPF